MCGSKQTDPWKHAHMKSSEGPHVREVIHNILLIQSDRQAAQVVRDALTNGSDPQFHIEWVTSCASGLERLTVLASHLPDGPRQISAILVDLLLPDLAGLEIIDRLAAAAPQIPIIALSSMQDELVA